MAFPEIGGAVGEAVGGGGGGGSSNSHSGSGRGSEGSICSAVYAAAQLKRAIVIQNQKETPGALEVTVIV